MRGEHAMFHLAFDSVLGSSPHARGALRIRRLGRGGLGIIPACAGSTNATGTYNFTHKDHPRMRGEHASPSR